MLGEDDGRQEGPRRKIIQQNREEDVGNEVNTVGKVNEMLNVWFVTNRVVG
jgi:hypothetical protein